MMIGEMRDDDDRRDDDDKRWQMMIRDERCESTSHAVCCVSLSMWEVQQHF